MTSIPTKTRKRIKDIVASCVNDATYITGDYYKRDYDYHYEKPHAYKRDPYGRMVEIDQYDIDPHDEYQMKISLLESTVTKLVVDEISHIEITHKDSVQEALSAVKCMVVVVKKFIDDFEIKAETTKVTNDGKSLKDLLDQISTLALD